MPITDIVFEKKYPTTKDNYIGVEIEFLLLRDKEKKLAEALVAHDLQNNVHLGYDGSVKDTEWQPMRRNNDIFGPIMNADKKMDGREIRILATEKEAPAIIAKVCALLAECGAKVNETAGLHVHLDMRSRNVDTVFSNFYYCQKLMFATQPKVRQTGKYSKLLRSNAEGKDKYYGVNKKSYERLRTLEIRMHEGTINASEICMWVGTLIKISNIKEKMTRQLKTFDTLGLPENVKGYLNARVKKYA